MFHPGTYISHKYLRLRFAQNEKLAEGRTRVMTYIYLIVCSAAWKKIRKLVLQTKIPVENWLIGVLPHVL